MSPSMSTIAACILKCRMDCWNTRETNTALSFERALLVKPALHIYPQLGQNNTEYNTYIS